MELKRTTMKTKIFVSIFCIGLLLSCSINNDEIDLNDRTSDFENQLNDTNSISEILNPDVIQNKKSESRDWIIPSDNKIIYNVYISPLVPADQIDEIIAPFFIPSGGCVYMELGNSIFTVRPPNYPYHQVWEFGCTGPDANSSTGNNGGVDDPRVDLVPQG